MTRKNRIAIAGTLVFGAAVLILSGCTGGPEPSVLAGATPGTSSEMKEQLVWVGTGTTYRWNGNDWQRTPESDYEFLVRQNRFPQHWESLKIQNRTHPDYDGSAGPADQQHFFLIEYGEPTGGGDLPITLSSTYGDGTGKSDREFREAVLEFDAAHVGRFAPYQRFRITQTYRYEVGLLEETVELFDETKEGNEIPFVRIEERARILTRD